MPDESVLRCGPAGWSYATWESTVFPRPKPQGFHPLEFLCGYFDTIEVNTSFYQSLRPEVTRLWLSRVSGNPRFVFTAKMHRRFTHDRDLEPGEISAFTRGLAPLVEAGKLGCVLMQFHWSFRFTRENRDFLIRLRRAFSEFALVAEFRHSSWTSEEALGLLVDYHVGFCNLDQPPHASAMPPTSHLTSAVGYVRLHGRSYGEWFRKFETGQAAVARHDYLYTPDELAEWTERIGHLRQFADATYVITNNDVGGRSVVNALQLQSMLGVGKNRAPSQLRRVYRKELESFRQTRPLQPLLFSDVPSDWDCEHRAVA